MPRIWPNGKSQPVDVWWEFGKRDPIWTPAGSTSGFHWGIDLGPGGGTRMVSPVDGVITLSRWDDVFGNWVHVTENGTGAELWLCHLASRAVSVGQHVRAGDYIGPMGETGKANGRHLHYEYHPGGQDRGVDPRDFYRSGAAAGVSSATRIIIPEEDDMKLLFITDSVDGNGVPGWALLNTRTGKLVTMRNSDPKNQERANSWARVWGNAKSCKRQDMLNAIDAIQKTA